MKILHLPYTYFPEPSGGTEVYVAGLARELAALGIESCVAFADPQPPACYEWEGVRVHRVEVASPRRPEILFGAGMPEADEGYHALVAKLRPDVIHVHAYTPALNGATAAQLRTTGKPLVITYHTPGVSCQRGTLMRFGNTVCDGAILVDRCSACLLQKAGLPRPLANALGEVPARLGRAVAAAGGRRGVWTALRMTELMSIRRRDNLAFFAAADVIVATSQWVRDVLVANGVPEERIVVSSQGVDATSAGRIPDRMGVRGGPLRIVVLARLDPTKGVHILLEALRLVPSLPVVVDVFGSDQGNSEYVAVLRAAAAADRRVQLRAPVARAGLAERLAAYDLMAVPSQTLETGPLVILEARAAGLPVIGSALPGIANSIRDGVDGMLVEADSAAAWAAALERVAFNADLLASWREAIEPPRTVTSVAQEMAELYREIAARRNVGGR